MTSEVGRKKDTKMRDYIVLLSNPIEEGTVQCIVEKLDLVTGNTAGQDGDTLAREVRNRKGDTLVR